MTIGWFAVLQAVPWSQVIENAPRLAEGAKKLWNAVGRKPAADPFSTAEPSGGTTEASAIASMERRIAALETAIGDLHSQMVASSEIIKNLAEQNAQLVSRIEADRLKVRWLTVLTVAALFSAGIALYISVAGSPS